MGERLGIGLAVGERVIVGDGSVQITSIAK